MLVAALGWRAVFWANLPIALIALVMALVWLPADEPVGKMTAAELSHRIDLPGIAGFAAAMASLLVFLDGLPSAHWVWPAIAAICAVAFVARRLCCPA